MNNNEIINNNQERLQNFILPFKFPMGTRKNFFQIYGQFRPASSKTFASTVLGCQIVLKLWLRRGLKQSQILFSLGLFQAHSFYLSIFPRVFMKSLFFVMSYIFRCSSLPLISQENSHYCYLACIAFSPHQLRTLKDCTMFSLTYLLHGAESFLIS